MIGVVLACLAETILEQLGEAGCPISAIGGRVPDLL